MLRKILEEAREICELLSTAEFHKHIDKQREKGKDTAVELPFPDSSTVYKFNYEECDFVEYIKFGTRINWGRNWLYTQPCDVEIIGATKVEAAKKFAAWIVKQDNETKTEFEEQIARSTKWALEQMSDIELIESALVRKQD